MLVEIEADEVDEFTSAVAGLSIEYVRTDAGSGPCRIVAADAGDVRLSAGSMGFSAVAGTEIPADVGIFALISCAPPGAKWCGAELEAEQLYFFGPGTSFMGVEPEGLAATMATIRYSDLENEAEDHRACLRRQSVEPLGNTAQVDRMRRALKSATGSPESVLHGRWGAHTLEIGAAALFVETRFARPCPVRRLDSRVIVGEAIDFVETSRTHRPTMRELCRATHTSESRLRQAFVEVFDVPPTQYFQRRLLSRMRNELLDADPTNCSVTDIAISLGITQFGRVAGRYRRAFDELPSETLQRRSPRSTTPRHVTSRLAG